MLLVASLFAVLLGTAAADAGSTITVEKTSVLSSAALAGLSIDNAAHSIYGGLYSQLVFGESFEESVTTADPALASAAWWQGDGGSVAPWLPYGDIVSSTNVQPQHGRRSAVITCEGGAVCPWCVAMGNRGLNGLGVSVVANKTYEGFAYFRTNGAANVSVGIFLGLKELATKEFFIPTASDWAVYNFALVPKESTPGATIIVSMVPDTFEYRAARGSCGKVATTAPGNGVSVGVDLVFIQPGAWGRFQGGATRARSDIAAVLPQTGALRFGGPMVLASDYVWQNMRGPLVSRPPRFHDIYYPFESNGFSFIDFLNVAEGLPRLEMVMVGISATAETVYSAAGLAEYLWAPASSQYGALRRADGHPGPYGALVVEVGSKMALTATYARQFTALVTAMSDVVKSLAPSLVPSVKFAIAAPVVVNVTSPDVKHLLAFCKTLQMCVWSQAVAIDDAAEAQQWIRTVLQPLQTALQGAGVPLVFGDVSYGGPNSTALGRSVHRALTNALVTSVASAHGVRAAFASSWAARLCDTDGTVCPDPLSAPQEQFDITPVAIFAQPPALAAALFRSASVGLVAPVVSHTATNTEWWQATASFSLVSPACTTACPCSLSYTLANADSAAVVVDVTLVGARADPSVSLASITTLSCGSDSALNTITNTTACALTHPHPVKFTSPTTLSVVFDPFSYTVVQMSSLTCF